MPIGIIAEYNPFHNGHIYQIKKAKQKWPNEPIFVFMSGKYVQRGEIAIASFRKRKKAALKNGVNKVFKLPFECSTQAAHIFASKAVFLVNKKKVDKLFFGSETGSASKLLEIAKTIYQNEKEYNKILKSFLKQGLSFPKSSNETLKKLMNKDVSLPNDILGLEYCKTIVQNNYPITPFALKREVPFHSDKVVKNIASATYIRKLILKNQDVSKYTPMTFNKKVKTIESKYFKFQKIVKKMSPFQLSSIKLVSEGMENLFKKNINCSTYEDFVDKCTSKRYTSSRIKRTMLYVLLKIKK